MNKKDIKRTNNDEQIRLKMLQNPGLTEMPDIVYSPIVNGKTLSCVAETEEVAYLLGLSYKYLHNPWFCRMACRMLKLKTRWSDV